jgi:recombination protein RecT
MIIAKTPKIASMPPDVISQAVLKAMIPDPTLQDHDDIYFVPYGRTIDVSFSHNYLQKLAYRNGAVKLIETHLIYDNDNVEVSENGVSYSINPFKKDRGEFAGVMVAVKLSNGETKYGFVGVDHIEKARKASKSGNNGPWKTWYLEMAKKVAIKNTLKGLDISPEFNAAVTIDNEDTDFSKANQAEAPSGADELEDMMVEASSSVNSAEEYIKSIGVAFSVKGDWIAVDVINSSESGVDELLTKMKLIEKADKPGMLFGKITELKV